MFLKDDEYSVINEDDNDKSPIPKPSAGPGQFANLHLKLKMKESVYKSYRVNNINTNY